MKVSFGFRTSGMRRQRHGQPVCLAAASGQASKPRCGAPQARGLTAKVARCAWRFLERSSAESPFGDACENSRWKPGQPCRSTCREDDCALIVAQFNTASCFLANRPGIRVSRSKLVGTFGIRSRLGYRFYKSTTRSCCYSTAGFASVSTVLRIAAGDTDHIAHGR